MSRAYEVAHEALWRPEIDELIAHNFNDHKLLLEEDMITQLKDLVDWGGTHPGEGLTEQEAYDYFVSYRAKLWDK